MKKKAAKAVIIISGMLILAASGFSFSLYSGLPSRPNPGDWQNLFL